MNLPPPDPCAVRSCATFLRGLDPEIARDGLRLVVIGIVREMLARGHEPGDAVSFALSFSDAVCDAAEQLAFCPETLH